MSFRNLFLSLYYGTTSTWNSRISFSKNTHLSCILSSATNSNKIAYQRQKSRSIFFLSFNHAFKYLLSTCLVPGTPPFWYLNLPICLSICLSIYLSFHPPSQCLSSGLHHLLCGRASQMVCLRSELARNWNQIYLNKELTGRQQRLTELMTEPSIRPGKQAETGAAPKSHEEGHTTVIFKQK